MDDIKYVVDEKQFRYYENGVLTSSFEISSISKIDEDNDNIVFQFQNPDSAIWIPRNSVDNGDFQQLMKLAVILLWLVISQHVHHLPDESAR